MKVVCINSSNKPKEIPSDQWIIEGKEYTVVRLVRMAIQGNKMGVLLKEVQIGEDSFPYEFYDSDRFKPVEIVKEVITNTEVEEFSI
jgi:hypothetical protein